MAPPSTRERLLRAVVTVAGRDGLGKLTTVSVTAEAGIAQPRLYRYFPSVEACVLEATERAAAGFQRVTAELRREMRDPGDVRELSAHYRAVFRLALRERGMSELALRSRHEPSVLGEALRKSDAEGRQAFADELCARGRRAGLRPGDRARVELLAHTIFDAVYGALVRLLRGEGASLELVAEELAHFTSAGTRAAFEHLLQRPTRRGRPGRTAPGPGADK